jgi:nucleotide-binding universal stress UspA family protein
VSKLVVGIDGSDASKHALLWAIEEARLRRAEVVALHAWEAPVVTPDLAPEPEIDLPGVIAEGQEAALRFVTAIVAEVAGDVADVTVLASAVEGHAVTVLVEAARGADLLVVGHRGRGGFAGLRLGSVSQQLAQHAPCPVVIHR